MNLRDEEILYKIDQEEAIAYGVNDAALSDDRAQAIEYYLGEPFGNEQEERSQVVSFDVQDTIESALPQLLKVFVAGDRVVQFIPRGPEDEASAEQETDYINYLVMERNPGFEIFYVWFKDALLSKNGYVKVWYEEEKSEEEESYTGLTEAQVQALASDNDIEILELTSYTDPAIDQMAVQDQAIAAGIDPMIALANIPMLSDVKIKITNTQGKVKIRNVAPENMMISVDTDSPDLQESRFVQHRESTTIAELRKQGFDVPDDVGFTDTDNFQEESNARDIYEEQYDRTQFDEVLVKDTYMMIDGERWRFVVVGNLVILKEKADHVPFACITPMLMPHRHIGRSYADLTMDIQLIKSTLIRGQLDNMYLSNNGRYAVDSSRVNIEDMLVSRPGGIVRIQGDPGSSIMPLSHPAFPPTSFTMVEYMDSMKEKRTGVTAYNQGLDANSLNKTATGVGMVMNAAQQRLELVARTFAETGVKQLFLLVHKLVRQNQMKSDVVRLRNRWVEVDPRGWKNRADLMVSVGLGTGSKDQQLAYLNTILSLQEKALGVGLTDGVRIYNALSRLTQNAGFKNPDEFWTNPAENPPQQQEPAPDPTEQAIQGQLAIEQMKIEADKEKIAAQAEIDRMKAEMQLQQEQLRSANDVAIEQEKVRAQMELERWKAELQAQVELQKEAMKLETQRAIKEMDTNAQIMSSERMAMAMNKPKTVIRDAEGKVIGVE